MQFTNLEMPFSFPEEFQFANYPGVVELKSEHYESAPYLFELKNPSKDQMNEIIDWLTINHPPISNMDFNVDPELWRCTYVVQQHAVVAYDPSSHLLLDRRAPRMWGYQFVVNFTMTEQTAIPFKLRFMN